MRYTSPDTDFWRGRRVLLTGHTGFKGAWLTFWLHKLGAQVTGISLPPATSPSLFGLLDIHTFTDSHYCDIRDPTETAALVASADPEIVFHLAAHALVRSSYRDPLGAFSTNVLGTVHVLDALRPLKRVKAVVAITTDKVYRNSEQPFPYRETDTLGGHDPYSASKAASELVIDSYRDSFLAAKGIAIASARAGNVIGGGDWSDDRLIPDAVRAWSKGQPLQIRRPDAIRPWQHVLEPLAGYLRLAERLCQTPELSGAWNFGPPTHEAATVRDVISFARASYRHGDVVWGDGTEGPHESGSLTLEIAKARTLLGIRPRWSLPEAVTRTLEWYRRLSEGESAQALCEVDIAQYLLVS